MSSSARSAGLARRSGSVDDDISLLGALNTVLRRWRVVFGLPLVAAAMAGGVTFLLPPTYTATTTFVPEVRKSDRVPGGLASLAGQLGIGVGGDPTESPRFYADILRSRQLLERTLLSRYPDPLGPGRADSTTLLRILRVDGNNPADSLARGVRRLNALVGVRVDAQTNIVTVSVDARYATLAAAVANRLVAYLNEFNTGQRQSQAREHRRFSEERAAAADSELLAAEEATKTFYERNRGWQQAPELVFEEERLRRRVSVGQDLYLTLKREYETARIEEVNDTPVITVIDPAVPPQRRSKPSRLLVAALALVLAGAVGVAWAFGADYLERVRSAGNREYQDFAHLMQHLGRRLTRPLVGAKDPPDV